MTNLTTVRAPALALLTALALTGCQGGGAGETDSSPAAEHGHVDGAEEADEAQLRLAVEDAETGKTAIFDLQDEEVVQEVEGSPDTFLSAADSRYIYLSDREADTVTTVDTGVWTVDHGDHYHYYRADPKTLEASAGVDPAHVISQGDEVTFFFDGDGEAKIYDRNAMGEGEMKEVGTVDPGAHHGVAVPFDDHILSTVPGKSADDLPSTLATYGDDSKATPVDVDCPEIHGTAVTSQGAVLACEKGVIAVDEKSEATINDYPDEAKGKRTWELEVGKELAAAPMTEGGIGILDTGSGEWQYTDTDAEVVSADMSADDSTLVALDDKGTVYSIDPASGKVLTKKKDLIGDFSAGEEGPGPSVVVDAERTYVSNPAKGEVLELDPKDDLREARSFDIGGAPASLAVTGR